MGTKDRAMVLEALHAADDAMAIHQIRRSCGLEPTVIQKVLHELEKDTLVIRTPQQRWLVVGKASKRSSSPPRAKVSARKVLTEPRGAATPLRVPQRNPAPPAPRPMTVAAPVPRIPEVFPGPETLVDEQRRIVELPVGARALIEAAPGCGKTHVACARIAHLLGAGTAPDNVLMISFTRSAVHELRRRISALARNDRRVRNVEIRTIDSLAWQMVRTWRSESEPRSYEDSINEALKSFEASKEDVSQWLERFQHVLVDETQDLVGSRARFVRSLLNALPASSGWAVFFDPAQSIYGWSNDGDDSSDGATTFIEEMRALSGSVQRLSLDKLHRTAEKDLVETLKATRKIVTSAAKLAPRKQLDDMVSLLVKKAGPTSLKMETFADFVRDLGPDASETLVLMRRRVDVLDAMSRLREAGLPFRLRLGGLPRLAAPWIAVVANDLSSRNEDLSRVTQSAFESTWRSRCDGRPAAGGVDAEGAWQLLERLGRTKFGVDFGRVADSLAQRVGPEEAFVREPGSLYGPILGTIHSSKGREAPGVVVLVDPEFGGKEEDAEKLNEEARVFYVGVSRARRRLLLKQYGAKQCSYFHGRAWASVKSGMQIELGLEGDVDSVWPMILNKGEEAEQIQKNLEAGIGNPQTLHVRADRNINYTRRLFALDDNCVGALSHSAVHALGGVMSQRGGGKPPLNLAYLTWVDTCTVAVRQDDPVLQQLRKPWALSRLWLAPVVAGLGYIKRQTR